jgi:UDP-glucose 4-epimerase
LRVLVTGGAGFIGSHVVDRALAGGHDVRIFDRRPSPYHDRTVEQRRGDLLDSGRLERAMRGCDAVVHMAAMADVDQVARSPDEAERVNARGTLSVLEAARRAGVARVVYASTIWVYSEADAHPVDEDSGLGLPSHLYTATKLAGEMYCRSYAELYGIETSIVRLGIPYGPRARPEAVIPAFVQKAAAGEPLTIAGDGRQTRRFVYVEDLADGLVRALHPAAANRVYNLTGEESHSIREIAETVRRAVADVEITHVPGRAGDLGGVEVSSRRAERELGWRPSTGLDEGIRRYVDWYRESARGAAARRESLLGRLANGAAQAATLMPVLAMLVMVSVFIAVLHRADGTPDDVRTAVLMTLTALTASLSFGAEAAGSQLVAARWFTALLAIGLLFPWHHDLTHMLHPDRDLVLVGLTGIAFGALAGASGRRLVRARLAWRG